jgi:hypothetical protein
VNDDDLMHPTDGYGEWQDPLAEGADPSFDVDLLLPAFNPRVPPESELVGDGDALDEVSWMDDGDFEDVTG